GTLAAGVERRDDVEERRTVRGIDVGVRGSRGSGDRDVRAAGGCRASDGIAGRARGGGPGKRYASVARGKLQAGRGGWRCDGRGGDGRRGPALAAVVLRRDDIVVERAVGDGRIDEADRERRADGFEGAGGRRGAADGIA